MREQFQVSVNIKINSFIINNLFIIDYWCFFHKKVKIFVDKNVFKVHFGMAILHVHY